MSEFDWTKYFEDNTLRLEVSHRGGGIEIDCSKFVGIPGAKMTAYQNYLGGGMTGSVQSDRNFKTGPDTEANANTLAERLKYYFWTLSNDEVANWDEWAVAPSFEAQQARAGSAY